MHFHYKRDEHDLVWSRELERESRTGFGQVGEYAAEIK